MTSPPGIFILVVPTSKPGAGPTGIEVRTTAGTEAVSVPFKKFRFRYWFLNLLRLVRHGDIIGVGVADPKTFGSDPDLPKSFPRFTDCSGSY